MSESAPPSSPTNPYFTPLDRKHDRAAFECSRHPALADYVQRQAMQDRERDAAAPIALIDTDGRTIIGYYTLSAAEVDLNHIPPVIGRKLPKYPMVPAIRLGRLAVADAYQGHGHGAGLLMHALERAEVGSHTIAAALLIVDAKDDQAVSFYQRFGFHRFKDTPNQLYLTMAEIRAVLAAS